MRVLLSLLLCLPLFAQGTPPDYQRFLTLTDKLRPLTPGIVGELHWLEKSDRFWYSRSTGAGTEYLVASAAGVKQPAFDHQRLAQTLAQQIGQTVNPARLALSALEFKADSLEFVSNAERYEMNLATY